MHDRFLALRHVSGLSQAELANRAGVSRSLVAAIEAGRNTPSVAAGIAVARALGVTVEELFATEADVAGPAGMAASDIAYAVLRSACCGGNPKAAIWLN